MKTLAFWIAETLYWIGIRLVICGSVGVYAEVFGCAIWISKTPGDWASRFMNVVCEEYWRRHP